MKRAECCVCTRKITNKNVYILQHTLTYNRCSKNYIGKKKKETQEKDKVHGITKAKEIYALWVSTHILDSKLYL